MPLEDEFAGAEACAVVAVGLERRSRLSMILRAVSYERSMLSGVNELSPLLIGRNISNLRSRDVFAPATRSAYGLRGPLHLRHDCIGTRFFVSIHLKVLDDMLLHQGQVFYSLYSWSWMQQYVVAGNPSSALLSRIYRPHCC